MTSSLKHCSLLLLLMHYCVFHGSLGFPLQDVHARFRTEAHVDVVGRFNERFILSLASCKACVVMDDELNILPISTSIRSITPLPNIEVSFSAFWSTFDLQNGTSFLVQSFGLFFSLKVYSWCCSKLLKFFLRLCFCLFGLLYFCIM